MPTERPEDDEPDLLLESGEYPLGGEGMPSLQSIEALRAAAEEALQSAAAEAEVTGGTSDYTAEGDMSQGVANGIRRALRKSLTSKTDLFAENTDPHLTDASSLAAEIGEMSVNGLEEDGVPDDSETSPEASNNSSVSAQIEDSASGPHTDRPIGNISLNSLAPMLSYGKDKAKGPENK